MRRDLKDSTGSTRPTTRLHGLPAPRLGRSRRPQPPARSRAPDRDGAPSAAPQL